MPVIDPGTKFEYHIKQKKDLITAVGADPSKYMMDFLNELGEQGHFVIGTPQETGEPSGIAGPGGKMVPYYVLTVLTATVKPDLADSPEGPQS